MFIMLNVVELEVLEFMIDMLICVGDNDGGIFISNVQGGMLLYLYSVGGVLYVMVMSYIDFIVGIYDIVVEDVIGCLLLISVIVLDGNDFQLELGLD